MPKLLSNVSLFILLILLYIAVELLKVIFPAVVKLLVSIVSVALIDNTGAVVAPAIQKL